ncbi:MAG TPA: hypothetical protein VM121_08385 [Acidimicrobiales bacterium]|nr:hypothetical protein [Acidimicrobiales bacterium]
MTAPFPAPTPTPVQATATAPGGSLYANRRFLSVILLFVAVTPFTIVLLTRSDAEQASRNVVLAVISLVFTGLACLLLTARNERGLGLATLRLGPWWISYFVVAFGLNSLLWIDPQETGSVSIIRHEYIPIAIMIATGALACWTFGYLLAPARFGRKLLRAVVSWAAPRGPWALRTPSFAVVLYGIGCSARLIQILTGRFAYLADPVAAVTSPSSSNQFFAILSQFSRFGLILAAIDAIALHRTTKARFTLIVIFGAEIAFGLISGMKSEFLLTVLCVGLVYSVTRGRLPRRMVFVGLLAGLLIVPINNAYRERVRRESQVISSAAAIQLLPGLLTDTLGPSHLPELLASSPETLANRLRLIDGMAVIVQRTPSVIPYKGGSEFLTAPVVGLVPRAVWSSKPVLATGYRFNQEYYQSPSTIYSASAITFPGDLYRHAGIWGVIVGMLLLGMTCRLVQAELYPGKDLRLLLIYVPFFVLFVNMELDAVSILSSLVQTLVLSLLVTKMSFVSKR